MQGKDEVCHFQSMPIVKSVLGFLVCRRSESKFAPTRREKRSVVVLHEYFHNEVGVNFGHV